MIGFYLYFHIIYKERIGEQMKILKQLLKQKENGTTKSTQRGFKNIAAGMILGIIPVVLVAIVALTIISVMDGREIINEQMKDRMQATLEAQTNNISSQMQLIRITSSSLASSTAANYENATEKSISVSLSDTLKTCSDVLFGCGLYFSDEAQGAPIAFRNDGIINLSAYDGDYKHESFYIQSLSTSGTTFLEPEYSDNGSRMIMKAITPMADASYKQLGCAVAELDLSELAAAVNSISVGDGGSAILISETGAFLAGVDESRIIAGELITDDANFSSISQQILTNEKGNTTFSMNGSTYFLYYDSVPDTGWKLLLSIPKSQMIAPVVKLATTLAIIGIIALILCIGAILLQVKNIGTGIKKVNHFANALADGNFTVNELNVKRRDELGQMSGALNQMFSNNRDILVKISSNAEGMDQSSHELQEATRRLEKEFEEIEQLMSRVNDDMMSSSSATQEVNASSEEITASVTVLTQETQSSKTMAENIMERAAQIEKDSREAFDYASKLADEYNKNLSISIANSAVVESIGQLAEMITNIADNINLLSLNASIEAARAGDAGRGFAVVAEEIGRLAGDTTSAATEIQNTINDVKQAFAGLTKDAESLLNFIQNTVTPDYTKFINVAKQYGEDAVAIEASSAKLSGMADNIEKIMDEIAMAVQSIATNTESTAKNSASVTDTVNEVSDVVVQVADMSRQQGTMASELNEVVGKFKL